MEVTVEDLERICEYFREDTSFIKAEWFEHAQIIKAALVFEALSTGLQRGAKRDIYQRKHISNLVKVNSGKMSWDDMTNEIRKDLEVNNIDINDAFVNKVSILNNQLQNQKKLELAEQEATAALNRKESEISILKDQVTQLQSSVSQLVEENGQLQKKLKNI